MDVEGYWDEEADNNESEEERDDNLEQSISVTLNNMALNNEDNEEATTDNEQEMGTTNNTEEAEIAEETNTTKATSTGRKGRFEGKVAIITSSNCGIDRATAILMGKEGAKVTLHGTDEFDLRRTVVMMVRTGVPQDDILVVEGPIDNDQTLKNLVEKTYNKFGRIDVLVLNAGGIQQQQPPPPPQSNNVARHSYSFDYATHNGHKREEEHGRYPGFRGFRRQNNLYASIRHAYPASGFDGGMLFGAYDNDFDLLFNINLKSITKLTRFCASYLEDSKGAVVNVSSFGNQRSVKDYTYYSTVKTALDNYCRSIAPKFAKRNIRVNNVNPGFIIGETMADDENRANKFELNWIKHHVPMGRGGTAEEISKVVAFLASDDASYITGTTIIADGAVSIAAKPADFF